MSKTYSAGIVTAYGAAKRAGYQGTYEDFCRQQAGYAESAATVEQAKNTAVSAANTATAKAGEAATAATAAQTAKTQTEAAASQALTDISTARSGAISAVQTEGQTQTANARAQAQAAAQSATTASTKASEASASATSAGQSATNAAASATSAANAASAAQGVLESIPQDYSDLSSDVDTLKADLGNLDNDIYELTNVPLDSAIWGNTQHTRIALKLGALDETLLRVINAPSTIKVSVTAWTSAGYATKVFDSGWLTTYPYSTVIDNALYYMISFAKSDFSEFTSLTDIDGTVIAKLQSRIESMNVTLTSLHESVDDVNGILYEQPLIDLNSLYFSSSTKQNISIKLDRFYDGGELIVKNLPENVQIGIGGYSGLNYVTRVTQSGWQKNTPFKLTINKDLYYLITFAKYDWSAFDSLDDVTSARLNVVSSVKPKIDNATPLTSLTVRSIAHRGDITIAPQNTAPSYILARKEGHTIGENDVWNSADNEYVMWHDTTLAICGDLVDINGYEMYTDGSTFYYYDTDSSELYTYTDSYVASSVDVSTLTRCNGSNYSVTGLTLAVLKRIDFGVYAGSQFKGTQILAFDEWILLMKRLGMDAYIDRKLGYTTTIVTELVNIVKKYGMLDHVSWIGVPTTDIIEAIRAVDSNARIGVLEHPSDTNIASYAPYNTGRGFFFNGDAKSGLTEESVQKGINAGFEVETYYVGYDYPIASETDIYAMINNAITYGVTGITLDHYRVDDAVKPLLDEYYIV